MAEEGGQTNKYSHVSQSYQNIYEEAKTGRISGKLLANKIENLKDDIRSQGDAKSNLGRRLNSLAKGSEEYKREEARLNTLTQTIEQSRSLRDELISIRNQMGVKPPAPIPTPKPIETQTDAQGNVYDSEAKTLTTSTGKVYQNVKGYTSDKSGKLKDVILEEGGKQITLGVRDNKVKAIQKGTKYVDLTEGRAIDTNTLRQLDPTKEQDYNFFTALGLQPQLSDEAKAASDFYYKEVEQSAQQEVYNVAASTAGNINKKLGGAQYVIVEKTQDGYKVAINPKITAPESVKQELNKQLNAAAKNTEYAEVVGEDGSYVVRQKDINSPVYLTSRAFKGDIPTEITLTPERTTKIKFESGKEQTFEDLTTEQQQGVDALFGKVIGEMKQEQQKQLEKNFQAFASPSFDKLTLVQEKQELKKIDERSSAKDWLEEVSTLSSGKRVDLPIETTKSGLVKTPITEFYETDYSQQVEGALRGVEDATGLYIKESPIGEVRLSGIVGFGADIVETSGKAVASVGTSLGAATIVGAKKVSGTELTERERLTLASDVVAGHQYSPAIPFIVGFEAVPLLGSAKTSTSLSSGLMRAGSKRIAIYEGETAFGKGIVQEFKFSSGGAFESLTPKGHPEYARLQTEMLASSIGKATSAITKPIKPISNIGKSAIKTGTGFAGLQTGIETFVGGFDQDDPSKGYDIKKGITSITKPESQERIKTAFLFGSLVGGGAQTFTQAKPFFENKVAKYKQSFQSVVDLPAAALRESVKVGKQASDFNKQMYFFAKSDKQALKFATPENKVFIPAELTRAGINPYEYVKSVTKESPKVAVERVKLDINKPSEITELRYLPPETAAKRIRSREILIEGYGKPATTQSKIRTKIKPLESVKENVPVFTSAFVVLTPYEIPKNKFTERQLERIGEKQKEAAKQQQKEIERVVVRQKLKTGQKQKIKQRVDVGLIEIPNIKIKQGLRVKLKVGEGLKEPPRSPRTGLFYMPSFKFEDSPIKRPKPSKRTKEPGFGYTPSLAGVLLGVKETKVKSMYSGFEIRGTVERKGKKPKKKKKKGDFFSIF